jgi:hypothetical protein
LLLALILAADVQGFVPSPYCGGITIYCGLQSNSLINLVPLLTPVVTLWSVTIDSFGLMIRFIAHFDTVHDYTLHFTITHTLVSTVTSALPLLRNSFQQQMFPFFWVSEWSLASAASFLTATAHSD